MKKREIIRMKKAAAILPVTFLLAFLTICCNAPINNIDSSIVPKSSNRDKRYPQTQTLGIVWDKYPFGGGTPEPVFPANTGGLLSNSLNARDPNVIKISSNEYLMWYSRVTIEISGLNEFNRYEIAYATSNDGINWTDMGVVAGLNPNLTSTAKIDTDVKGGVRVSSVVRVPYYEGHIFKMWYLGKDKIQTEDNWKLYYAESMDGINWNKQYFDDLYLTIGKSDLISGTFYEKYVSSCSVLSDKSNYKMWFGGYNKDGNSKIGFASSNEGTEIDWKITGEILKPGFAAKGHFDKSYIENPFVLKDGNVYLMWYSGKKHNWQVGLAYSLDGKKFDYYNDKHESVLKPFDGYSRWERLGIRSVCVIKDEISPGVEGYKMWYAAESNLGKFRIGYAESIKRD